GGVPAYRVQDLVHEPELRELVDLLVARPLRVVQAPIVPALRDAPHPTLFLHVRRHRGRRQPRRGTTRTTTGRPVEVSSLLPHLVVRIAGIAPAPLAQTPGLITDAGHVSGGDEVLQATRTGILVQRLTDEPVPTDQVAALLAEWNFTAEERVHWP